MKATRLERRTPLRARTPLSRTSGLGANARAREAAENGNPPRKTVRRDTGPSARVRAAVLERDQYQCVGCGKPVGLPGTWWSIQHRIARGVGGDNSLPNLIALCGSATSPGCHRVCEDRDEEAHARGLWLESGQDPALESVMLASEYGSGITVWLLADGTYSTEAPRGAV